MMETRLETNTSSRRSAWLDRVSNISDGTEILKIARRRMSLILASIAVVVCAAVLYVYMVTPEYRAEVQLVVEQKGGPVYDVGSTIAGQLQDQATIVSEIGVIKSRTLAKRVIEKLDLWQSVELNSRLQPLSPVARFLSQLLPERLVQSVAKNQFRRDEPSRIDESSTVDGNDEAGSTDERVVDAFVQRVEAKQIPQSRTISITYTSTSPKTAANVLNTLADLYIVGHLEDKFKNAQRASRWLADQIQRLKQDVEESERAIEDYRRQHSLFDGQKEALVNEQVSTLSLKLIDANVARLATEANLAQTRRLMNSAENNAESLAKVLDSPLIQRYRDEEMELDRKEADYAQQYGGRHPLMVQLQAEKDRFRQKVSSEVAKIFRSEENEAQIARTREAAISRDLESLKTQMAKSNEAAVGLRALERTAEANRLLLQKFRGAFMETNAQEDVTSQIPDGRLISPAAVPDRPSFPKKALTIFIALTAGSSIGVLLAVTVDCLDSGFSGAEDLESVVGVPVLAHVPRVSALHVQDISCYIIERPKSAFAESVWSLYTRLSLTVKEPQVVLIISSLADEGKTTIAMALARQQAQCGRRVVLVDADLRGSRLVARVPGFAKSPGFGEILAGAADLCNALQPDPLSDAHIIIGGESQIDRLEFRQSKAISGLFATLRERYQLIIVEAPPILALSDAYVLQAVADATLLIVHWGKTHRRVVEYVANQITRFGGRLDGVVLSMVDIRKNATYGHGDSAYYSDKFAKYYSG